MKKKLLIAAGVCALLILSFWTAWPNSPREPEWEGKPLSFWIVELRSHNPNPAELSPRQLAAKRAVRAIGTNAVPWLLTRIRTEPAHRWWKSVDDTYYAVRRLRIDLSIATPTGIAENRADEAIQAFHALGPIAGDAAPELRIRLRAQIDTHSLFAAIALGGIGSNGINTLVAESRNTNRWIRSDVACGLGYAQTDQEVALATLLFMSSEKDRIVRGWSAKSLGQFTNHTSVSLPALVRLLKDSDPHVRFSAASAFRYFNGDISSAEPELRYALSDSSVYVREYATEALRRIPP